MSNVVRSRHELIERYGKNQSWMNAIQTCLGVRNGVPAKEWCRINFIVAQHNSLDYAACTGLVEAGLMSLGETSHNGDHTVFHVTDEGCRYIGLHQLHIDRAKEALCISPSRK